jgi:hypothetical protein
MAKQLLRTYVFVPGVAGSGTISVPGKWDLNQLLIITNTKQNVIIYNFADTTYTNTTVSFSRANTASFPQALQNTDGVTTFSLGYDTSGMSASDSLQIFVEKGELITRPWAMGTDAFERTRMSAPKSMLDADFEYGLQPTKWQTISMIRGYPGIYEIPGTDLQTISTITTDYSGAGTSDQESLITVNCTSPHNFSAGTPLTVKGLLASTVGYARAEGSFVINTVPTPTSFTYYAKARVGSVNGEAISTTYTQIRKGGFYTGAAIGAPTFSVSGSGPTSTGTVTVSFTNNHGLIPGSSVYVGINSDNGVNNNILLQGPFYITQVPDGKTLIYSARAPGLVTGTPSGSVYVRSDSFYVHRPFDGGVMLGNGSPTYGSSSTRMSKKYIRYQSGKAVNYNTGALFAPNFDLRSLTATGTNLGATVTATTDDTDHGLQAGAIVVISGAITSGYNGTYTVASIVDERTFTYTATTGLGSTTAVIDTPCLVSLLNWYGSTVRAGTFDDQNGMFWQFDGQIMALGLRTSTLQLAGTATATPDSNLITGANTRFTEQLAAGDRIVIRGMSHVVSEVTSATQITVTPDYRGAAQASAIKAVKTRDILVPQSQWNQDRCDGTNSVFNPSGYNLLPNKMQMIGLQWTWYGAGFIDYMLRGPDGSYITVHRIKNSNVNNEAYMRSGNMPVRYEVLNESGRSALAAPINSVATVMTVTDVTYFPPAGLVLVDQEVINYTSKVTATNQLIIAARGTAITQWVAGSLRTFNGGGGTSHVSGTGVIIVGQTASPNISHWGSAFLSDGGFDDDRGYIFNYAATNVTASTKKTTAFALRLAPSVSNAIVGDLGSRELINRAQLLLQGIEITAGGSGASQALIVEGVLNPSNYPSNLSNITWSSLAISGQPSFSQVAIGSSIAFDSTATNSISVATGGGNISSGTNVIQVNTTASIAIGDAVYGSLAIPGAAIITAIGSNTITISNPLISTLRNNDPLIVARNQYALPGEQIFSFISSPAAKDSLDLTPLKELTNTPIGGRGTFPNGPDVLMINVYVTQGGAIPVNLILRWGEAQA